MEREADRMVALKYKYKLVRELRLIDGEADFDGELGGCLSERRAQFGTSLIISDTGRTRGGD